MPFLSKDLVQSMQRENGQSVYNCLKRWENLLKEDICKTKLAKEIDQAAKIVGVSLAPGTNTSRRKPKTIN